MLKWLEPLLLGVTTFTGVFSPLPSPSQPSIGVLQSSKFLSDTTVQWLDEFRDRYKAPGIGLGLIASPKFTDSDWQTEMLNFGSRNLQEQPYEADTLVRISSNAKLFTAVAVGLLVDNHTIMPGTNQPFSFQTQVQDIIDDWELQDKYVQEHVTILDLLSMRSGLPQHYLSYGAGSATEQVKQMRYLRPSTEIREQFQYDDHHYWVLAEIVRQLSGVSFTDYVQEHILNPLQMSATTFNDSAVEASDNRADHFFRMAFDNIKCRETWDRTHEVDPVCVGQLQPIKWFLESEPQRDFFAGPAGMASTFRDMAKWIQELLEPRVLPKRVIEDLTKKIIPAFNLKVDEISVFEYGHAVMSVNYRGHEVHLHPGIQPGVATVVATIPSLGFGCFIATNEGVVGAPLNYIVLYRILDDLFNLEPIDWEKRLIIPWLIPDFDSLVPSPETPRPAPKPESIVGVYYGQAYGYLNISRLEDPPSDLEVSVKDLKSSYDPVSPRGLPLLYVATMSNLYCRGLLLAHFDGPVFKAPRFVVRTMLNGTSFPFFPDHHTAVFVEGEGVGLFGRFWGEEVVNWAVEEDVSEKAEVWFAKVE